MSRKRRAHFTRGPRRHAQGTHTPELSQKQRREQACTALKALLAEPEALRTEFEQSALQWLVTQLRTPACNPAPKNSREAWNEAREFFLALFEANVEKLADFVELMAARGYRYFKSTTDADGVDLTQPSREGIYAIVGILRVLRSGELQFPDVEDTAATPSSDTAPTTSAAVNSAAE